MRIHLMLITVTIKRRFFSEKEIERAYDEQKREEAFQRTKDRALRNFFM